MRRAALATTLLWVCACGTSPGLSLRAPGKIESALSVVSALGASATLIPKGGDAQKPVKLERGDDGVTFTGFLPADPGNYTLAIVFTGVPDGGARHFLGRLTSDAFTVTRGESTTPSFNKPVDVLGGADDHGDDDDDGLGFLDELLLGTDPDNGDSDNDGVLDGADCVPDSGADVFPIADGGSVEDCDADGHRGVNAPFGERGTDCDDENADVHPGVDDDCGTAQDQDCNPSTCPIDDSDGPSITITAPADGDVLGCQGRVTATLQDPSGVTGASASLPDSPFPGDIPRTVLMSADPDDDSVFHSQPLANGGGIAAGSQPLVVSATDAVGNTSTAERSVSFAFDFPTVSWSGPTAIVDAPIEITLTPAGARPLVDLELRASPFGEFGLVDGSVFEVVQSVAVSGGVVTLDPADLTNNTFIWVYARDDRGNESTLGQNTTVSAEGSARASWLCEPTTEHAVPGAAYRASNAPITLLEHLDEAIATMATLAPDHALVKIIGFGFGADGRMNLAAPGFFFLCYGFNEPSVPPADPNDDDEGKSVCWYSADYGQPENPVVDENDGSLFSDVAIPNVGSLLDSPALLDLWPCVEQFDGTDEDTVLIIPNDDASVVHGFLYTENTSWSVDPYSGVEEFACDPQ